MKTTLCLLLALAGSAFAATTTWYHGGTNNSALFGVTPTNSTTITWRDNWAGGSNFDSPRVGSPSLQSTRPDITSGDQSIMSFGFDGTGITSSQVDSAFLYLVQD